MSQNNILKTERINTLDIAKGIAMILVVFAHVNYTPDILVLIYSFHMPLFFMISGMLFRKEKYSNIIQFLKRRIKTLIIPYLLFSLSALVYVYISERMFPGLFDISKVQYIGYFKQIFLAQGSKPVLNTPLWFVLCLFAVEIMYYFISKLKARFIVPVCFILTGIGWILESGKIAFDNTILPWTFDTALFALGFYAIGNLSFGLVKNSIIKIKNHNNKTMICLGIILLCAAFWLPATLINGKVSLGSRVLHNGFLFYLTGILGTIIILAISVLLEKNKFLQFCGRNSFSIMAVHYMIRKFTLPKYYALFGIAMYNRKELNETIIPFLIILLTSLLFTKIYNKLKDFRKK